MLYVDEEAIQFDTDYGRRIFKFGTFFEPEELRKKHPYFTHAIRLKTEKGKRGKQYKITTESMLHFLHCTQED